MTPPFHLALPHVTQLQAGVDQKQLAEARSGILSILHTIMSSVTLLWSVLYLADSSEGPAAASASCLSNINLGSTKVWPGLSPCALSCGVPYVLPASVLPRRV